MTDARILFVFMYDYMQRQAFEPIECHGFISLACKDEFVPVLGPRHEDTPIYGSSDTLARTHFPMAEVMRHSHAMVSLPVGR